MGPANAGKVELLLDRYVAALDRDPYLIVPGRPDVDRVERELLARCHGLLGGDIGTFDDLFRRIAAGNVAGDVQRRRAAERLGHDLDAWHGEPVFAYGFEDLTGAQWTLLEALAGRAEVTVSLPYEPGRVAFASLWRTAEDLSRLADGRIEELPPAAGPRAHAPALAYLERSLFEGPAAAPRTVARSSAPTTISGVTSSLTAASSSSRRSAAS